MITLSVRVTTSLLTPILEDVRRRAAERRVRMPLSALRAEVSPDSSRRERLLAALRGELPEWIPMAGHCDPYNQPSREGMDPDLAEARSLLAAGRGDALHLGRQRAARAVELDDQDGADVAGQARRVHAVFHCLDRSLVEDLEGR